MDGKKWALFTQSEGAFYYYSLSHCTVLSRKLRENCPKVVPLLFTQKIVPVPIQQAGEVL